MCIYVHVCHDMPVVAGCTSSFPPCEAGTRSQVFCLGDKYLYLLSHFSSNFKIYSSMGAFSKFRGLWLFYVIEIWVIWGFCDQNLSLYSDDTFKTWPILWWNLSFLWGGNYQILIAGSRNHMFLCFYVLCAEKTFFSFPLSIFLFFYFTVCITSLDCC